MKYEESFKLKLIYIYRINDKAHKGCVKIGDTFAYNITDIGTKPNSKLINETAKKRINDQTRTAAVEYELLHTELTAYLNKGKIESFTDHEVHNVLLRSGIKKKIFNTEKKANEWYETDLETVKKAIVAVKAGQNSLHPGQVTKGQSPIIFRPEQKDAIEKTAKQFKKSNEMLWFAKMRFGKTLSALQVVKDNKFKKTLILTHRPVVDKGWFEDFGKIFYDSKDFFYGSKTSGDKFATLEKKSKTGKNKYIYFASMQDLRGSDSVGGLYNKNDEIFDTQWDFIIVDEAHEGTQTELGKNVVAGLKTKNTKILHLSGTPFNLLDNYKENEIFTWDYVMEQKAKADWDITHFGDPNPYSSLPRLNIFTYNLGKLLKNYVDEEVAFNFREFFRINEKDKFIHQKDVESFLNLLCKKDDKSNYPYSTEEYRDNFRHSLWMVPGVKEAKALSELLKKNPVFSQFKIVNVAGDGDEEEEKDEALKKVDKAIGDKPHETYTITLSCGRLTTGVTVKAWTAVFMLSGTYNTSASTYMQTIFRVQTPATINGKVKDECFVFDFAPDRTLKVIAEAVKISSKADTTKGEDKVIMGEFLNFCPIIAYDGSKMKTYDVKGLLEQLKKVYIERVVNNGFEDSFLYDREKLMKLNKIQVNEFNGLKKTIGTTAAMTKTKEIDVNNQGLTKEEHEVLEQAKKKNKKELSAKEKKLLEKLNEQKKMREIAISILRGISIRMPLLIYGADVKNEETEIDIDNFTDLVDDSSWVEFMPKGVTKQTFNNFKKYYDPDIFSAAGKRIRAIARAADDLTIEERIERITHIFGTFRNPDKETVLTPWRVVNMHLGDCMGGYSFLDESRENTVAEPHYVSQGKVTDAVFSTNSKVLEINSKSGLYPLYVAYSIYRNLVNSGNNKNKSINLTIEQQQKFWDKVVAENIFVISKTPMAKAITKRTLVGFRKATTNIQNVENIVEQITNEPEKFVKKIKNAKLFWNIKNGKVMKFDAIVGNPPYQLRGDARDEPIYHHFYDISKNISERYSLISPGRFLFGAGQTPKSWNKTMLSDKHIKVVLYEQDSKLIFPGTDIKGGIAIIYRDKNQDFGSIGTFTHFQELKTIVKKISKTKMQSFSKIVQPQGIYRFSKEFFDKFPDAEKMQGKGTKNKIVSKSFSEMKFVFVEQSQKLNKAVKILGLVKGKREYKWIDECFLQTPDSFYKWKVFVPEANGTGAIGEILSTPLIGEPLIGEPCIGHTDTFLTIGAFNSEIEAKNCLKYIKSKFARTMLGILKITQHNSRSTWKFVPLQDFTNNLDINWSKTIPEIDKQLYKKYKLSKDEIEFIEKMIKPMKD